MDGGGEEQEGEMDHGGEGREMIGRCGLWRRRKEERTRELTGAEKTAVVAEETDIDAEEANQGQAGEESNINRGVTDLDATAKTPDLNHIENEPLASEEVSLLVSSPRMLLPAAATLPPAAPLSTHHQIQLLGQQLQQQQQQTHVAVAQSPRNGDGNRDQPVSEAVPTLAHQRDLAWA
ncbi:unnamed protein product [Pleuronectes platessa]|uniref:Uncharacterized protein n=1 Tax=Pleuronectes platessa TaxID=8262 RepID=A0A9N7YDG9_PLEPL|nr:unnamed protein product [Pleuronectes platessa]